MPEWARQRFQAIMHKRGAWASSSSPAPANEQFAEAYSLCARKRTIRRRAAEGYRYDPTPAEHQQACGLIRRAAA
jgi:hypothetical protein